MVTRNNVLIAFLIVLCSLTKAVSDYCSKIKSKTLEADGKEYNWVTVVPDALFSLLFNGGMLVVQYFRGQITSDQIDYIKSCGSTWKDVGAWKYLVLAAFSDVADILTGLAAQPYLTTFMMSLANQATVVFTALISLIVLGTRYIAQEVIALTLVVLTAVTGAVLTAQSDETNNNLGWALFAAVTTSFAALGFVIKEIMFSQYRIFGRPATLSADSSPHSQQPPQQELSVFIVATGVGLISLLVSVPMAIMQQTFLGDGFDAARRDLADGLSLLIWGDSTLIAYLAYVGINLGFNLCLLLLTSYGSAVMAFLSLKLAVPVIALLSPLPWPLIGPHPLGSSTFLLLAVMLAGIAAFRHGSVQRETRNLNACCWPACQSAEIRTSLVAEIQRF